MFEEGQMPFMRPAKPAADDQPGGLLGSLSSESGGNCFP